MTEAKIIEQYFDHVQEATRTLTELESRAETIKGQGERRDAARADIRANETNIEQLMQERRELMRFFLEAEFEGDVQHKASITKRRLALDSEVKKLGKEVDRLHKVASENEPDPQEVAALAVALDSVNFPNPFDFAESLKKALWPQDNELSKRKQSAKNVLPSVDYALYQKAKLGEDGYEARLRVEALRTEESAEKARKLRERISREELVGAGPVDGRVAEREPRPWED